MLGYALMLPAVLFLAIFIWLPMGQAVYYSLFKWQLSGAKRFLGIDNYTFLLLEDLVFKKVLANTFVFTLLNVAGTAALALAAALLLQRAGRWNGIVRSAAFIPVVVPMAVMGLIWKMLYEPKFGLINMGLGLLGLKPVPFLFEPGWAMVSVLVVSIWKEFGLYTIILIGGLQAIPKDVYESAEIDGSGRARTFFYLTLPLLRPILFFVLTMLLIGSFKTFDHIWVMTEGGPGNATSVLVTFIFSKIFDSIGLAAAASVLLLAIVLLLTVLQYRLIGRDET